MKQKGMELSVNFVVILIFSIVIFGMSLVLIGKFFSFAKDTQVKIDQQTTEEIMRRLIRGNSQVAMPKNKMDLKLTQSGEFGVGIRNTFSSTKEFGVKMEYVHSLEMPGERAVPTEHEGDGNYINQNWVFQDIEPVKLKPTETEIVPLTVKVDAAMAGPYETRDGSYDDSIDSKPTMKDREYIFNVCVFVLDQIPKKVKYDDDGNFLYIDQPCVAGASGLYGRRVHKAYVVVS